jgi:hypothetical protein
MRKTISGSVQHESSTLLLPRKRGVETNNLKRKRNILRNSYCIKVRAGKTNSMIIIRQ